MYCIMRKTVGLYHYDEVIFEWCKLLRWLADDMVSFKRYCAAKRLPDDMAEIAITSDYYSQDALKYFVQTLEYLFALGYGGLEMTIYGFYRKIRDDSVYELTALGVSRALSCVYIIDDDNKYAIAKRCRKLYKRIEKSHAIHLRGICFYYMGLVDEFDCNLFNHDDVFEDCLLSLVSNYMDASAKDGFILAKKYIKHNRNFETSYSAELCGSEDVLIE